MPSSNLRLRQARRSTSPNAANFLQQQEQGFVPTQPGDPDFSLSQNPDTQAQFPAAAAEQRLHQNATSSSNVLEQARMAGFDTSGGEFDPIREQAETGFAERALTLGENLINFIDGPREAINILFQDIAGGTTGEGLGDAGLGDYLDALWFGVEDQEQFTQETGLRPDSGSHTLELMGWDEEESLPGKIGRGVASFGFEVLTDPLTYVTFGLSGLGKGVVKATAKKFSDDVVKQIVPAFKAGTLNAEAISSPYARRTAKNLQSIVDEFVPRIEDLSPDTERLLRSFLTNKKGLDVPDDPWAMMELVQDNVVELAIHDKVGRDVLAPGLRRAFGEIDKDALKDLPKYMYGGARLSVPWSRKSLEAGIVIPHTQGLGKKLVGDQLRKASAGLKKTVPGYNKLANTMKSMGRNIDQDRSLMDGLSSGRLEGWQYHIMQTAEHRADNLAHKETILTTLNALGRDVRRAAEDASKLQDSPITDDQVWAATLERLQRSASDTLIGENLQPILGGTEQQIKLHDGLDKEITKLSDFLRDTFDSYHEVLSELDPTVVNQYVKNYVPYVVDDEIGLVLSELAGTGGVIGRNEWQAMQSQGNPGGVFLDQLLNGIGKGGRIETQMGASRYFNPKTGRQNALTLTDSGAVLFDNDYLQGLKRGGANVVGREGEVATDVLQSTYFTVTELNDMVGPLVERLAKENSITLPKKWAGNIFKTNPLQIAEGYVNNLDEVISTWSLMNALRTAGLVFDHSTAPNVQNMMQSMMRNMVKNTEEMEIPGPTAARLAPADYGSPGTNPGAVIDDQGKVALTYDPEVAGFGDLPTSHMEAMDQLGKNVGDEGTVVANLAGDIPSITTHNWEGLSAVARRRTVEMMEEHGATQFRVTDTAGSQVLDVAETARAVAPKTSKKVLRGYEDMVAKGAVPTRTVKSVVNAGFGSVDDARDVMQIVARGEEAFRGLRRQPLEGRMDSMANMGVEFPVDKGKRGWSTDFTELADGSRAASHILRDDAGDPLMVLSIENTADGPLVSFQQARNLTGREKTRATFRILNKVDELAKSGDLRLTKKNLLNLMEQESITDAGADIMYKYLRRTLGRLDNETKEILTGNPGEYVDFQTMYDDFAEELNLMFNDMSAYYDPATETFITRAAGKATAEQFAGDDVFLKRIKGLREAAQQLDDAHGFETAMKVFNNIDDYMGLADQPGFVNPRWFALGGPAIEGMTVQPDIGLWLRQLSRNMSSIYTPEGVASLKMASNSVLKWWKAMATIARPGFHIRNLVGGVWNGMIVGVGPQHYASTSTHGVTLRNALRSGLDFEDALQKLPADERVFWQAAWDEDVLSGFVSTEFRKLTSAEKKGRLAWANVADIDNFVLTRTGGKFMESIEDFMRMSTFRAWFDPKDPGTAKIAKEMVENVHFNYNKLTPLETRLKSLVPFFVWSRRNIPLQLRTFAENPRMIQRYRAMLNGMNDNFEEDNPLATSDYYSAFAADTGFTVNEGTPHWARVMIDPDLPVRDLVDLPMPGVQGVFEMANNLLGPHVTTLFDLNGQRDFGDVNAPAPFNAVLQSLAAVGLYDRSTSGDVRVPYYMRTIMETALPFGRDVADPLTGGPTDPNRQARVGVTPDDNPLEASIKALTGTLGRGLGVQMSTPADSRSASARSGEQIDGIIEQLRLQGKLPPAEGSGSGVNLDDILLDIGN